MKKGLWRSSLVSLTMLTSLSGPVLVSFGSTALADSNGNQSVYVVSGDNGLSASVGSNYTNSSRPALDRAYRALGDPSKVGDSINQQTDLKQIKQTARQSLSAYGQKANDYLNDQNLSDHVKAQLQSQLKQVLTIADSNLDQAKSLGQIEVALHTGAYGVLATASATTVSQAKSDINAAQVAESAAGNHSLAMATSNDQKDATGLIQASKPDQSIDTDNTDNQSNDQITKAYQQFLNQMSQKLDQYLSDNNSNNNNSNSNRAGSSSSSSSIGQSDTGTDNQSGDQTENSNSLDDNGEQPGKGKNFDSVQSMIQYLNSQHGSNKLNSVRGATVETTIKMTHKAEGDYKTIFADNDGTLFLSKTGYNNIKPRQKVKVTIDSVSEGSANSPLGESVGWYDYTVTFSDLNIINESVNGNKQSVNGNNGGQAGNNSGNVPGQNGQSGNNVGSQTGNNGNAPTGSTIPQTGQSKFNSWISGLGLSLAGLLGVGVSRQRKKHQ